MEKVPWEDSLASNQLDDVDLYIGLRAVLGQSETSEG